MKRLTIFLGGLALGSASGVTFNEDVAPVVYAKCAGCHRPGQAAPFSFLGYEQVKRRGKQIVEVTGERYMPPWHADPGVVEYANDRSLSDEEIALIKKWVEAGSPEGDPAKKPAVPDFPEGWQIGEPDLVATMAEPFPVPAEGRDIYRNFVIPLGLEEDKWVKGLEFKPGDAEVVHHILYYLDTKQKGRELDARDPEPGYNGMGRSNGEFRYIGGWDLGTQAAVLPSDLAWFVPKGTDLVIQVHYHPIGKATKDQSSVAFHFADKPTARPWTIVPVPRILGSSRGSIFRLEKRSTSRRHRW